MKKITKISTETINNALISNKTKFIADSENNIIDKIKSAGESIAKEHPKKRLILISGPSGSGKTTSSIKLYQILHNMGYNVCYISMDKYFKDFNDEERELKKLHKIDLEAPERVDADYIRSDIQKLLNNEEINIPEYDFPSNTRTITDKKISAKDGFIIVEGIHALNPEIFGNYDDISSKIYVSVRTRITDSNSDTLHPCKVRLLRRMLRDKMYRSRDITDTIKMFPSVQHGENQYILPYKNRADYDIDTFISYEPCLYRNYLFDDLQNLAPKYADIRDIVVALDEIEPMASNTIPSDAIIREFIGGSTLSY